MMIINPIHNSSHNLEIKEGFSDVLLFYLFYTEDCPHSNKFMNEQWLTLSRKYQGKILFDKFDCRNSKNKAICESFNIKSVPALFLIEGDTHLQFRGERTLNRIDSFLAKNLKEHFETNLNKNQPKIIISDTLPSEESLPTERSFKKIDLILPLDAELTKNEDYADEIYEYCVKYPEKYKEYNSCLSANIKKEKGIKPYQLAYTILSTHIRRSSGGDPKIMKKNAYQLKDKIAEWGLAQKELLEQIYNQSQDQEDQDIASAFLHACGFI